MNEDRSGTDHTTTHQTPETDVTHELPEVRDLPETPQRDGVPATPSAITADPADPADPPDTQPSLDLPVSPLDLPAPAYGFPARPTEPVPVAVSTAAYPSLPARYTLDDDPMRFAGPADPVGPTGPSDPAAPTPAFAPAATAPAAGRVRRSVRLRTLVFGLALLAISVVSLLALLTDVRIDGDVVGLGLLIGAGAALVAGGVAAAVRESRGGPGAVH